MAVCLSARALSPLRELSPKRLLRMTEPFELGLCDNGTNEGRGRRSWTLERP